MFDSTQISIILQKSPSTDLLQLKNRETIIGFLVSAFPNQQSTIGSDSIHAKLYDYLQDNKMEKDDDDDENENKSQLFDTFEIKAKKHIQKWTNKGFLTNYQDEKGEIFYELSAHTHKTLDWLCSLKKEDYVGTESKFKNIFSQLKELVEFTNTNKGERVQILESKKLEIEQQIQRIKSGEDIRVFESYEIEPRFKQLTQSAKELLSDFKEVEDNFKDITKGIYQKHAESNLTKNDILQFTFDALDSLKDSQQGKSFEAFSSFLFISALQEEWKQLIEDLYKSLEAKEIPVHDFFLKEMRRHLHTSAQKINRANDKMAEKLSRIIRENQTSKTEITKNIIQDIKKCLVEISKTNQTPDISFEIEAEFDIHIPFERKLTYEQSEVLAYNFKPKVADNNIAEADQLSKLFKQSNIDKDLLRIRIKQLLNSQGQTTLHEVIAHFGGLEKGLPELFGYIGVAKEFKYAINADKAKAIEFDKIQKKSILTPEIILLK
jgi:hypothetical protein